MQTYTLKTNTILFNNAYEVVRNARAESFYSTYISF